MLKNYMEIVVEDILPSVLVEEELECKCERCKEDIMAITLNNLKPMYVATNKGVVYSQLNQFSGQFNADVIREITIAIEKVKGDPRH